MEFDIYLNGIVGAARYFFYVILVSFGFTLVTNSLFTTILWELKESVPAVKKSIAKPPSNSALRKIYGIYLLIAILIAWVILDDDPSYRWLNDARSTIPVVVLMTFISALNVLGWAIYRRQYLINALVGSTFGTLGGIIGFLIGFPSFGQNSFSEIGVVLFSGAGALLAFVILKDRVDLFLSQAPDVRDDEDKVAITLNGFRATIGLLAFIICGFLVFAASNFWGYSVVGFNQCKEIYGDHVVSILNEGQKFQTNHEYNKLFWGFCESVMEAFSESDFKFENR